MLQHWIVFHALHLLYSKYLMWLTLTHFILDSNFDAEENKTGQIVDLKWWDYWEHFAFLQFFIFILHFTCAEEVMRSPMSVYLSPGLFKLYTNPVERLNEARAKAEPLNLGGGSGSFTVNLIFISPSLSLWCLVNVIWRWPWPLWMCFWTFWSLLDLKAHSILICG